MSMIKKITPAQKKNITNDFLSELPTYGKYKNMWLMKIVGPFSIGVNLDIRSSRDRYWTTFHVSDLFNNIGVAHFGSNIRPITNHLSVPIAVTYLYHQENFTDIIGRIKSKVPWLLCDTLTKDVLTFIQDFIKNGGASTEYPLLHYISIISYLIWVDSPDKRDVYEQFRESLEQWPSDIVEYLPEVTLKSFNSLSEYLDDKEGFKKVIDANIQSLGMDSIPRYF